MSSTGSNALDRHRIPAIDRMMDVLTLLERRPNGATIREMVEALKLPRTTVYRILNTLQHHDMVRRSDDGSLRLGPRLLALAARTLGNAAGLRSRQPVDAASAGTVGADRRGKQGFRARRRRRARRRGRAGKPRLRADRGSRSAAAAARRARRARCSSPSCRKPQLQGLLGGPLAGYTSRTIRDPHRLSAELARIRRQGYAHDKGEYAPSINAFAAPIPDRTGKVIAALSVPYLAGADKAHMEKIRVSVIAVAGAIAADLPGQRPASRQARSGRKRFVPSWLGSSSSSAQRSKPTVPIRDPRNASLSPILSTWLWFLFS